MCVLAAQQDNETNAANDYSMSGKTNRGRAREEAADAKPCQVQLDHLRSFAGRADKVQFVQHISVHLSHMCSPLAAFSAVLWANIRTFPRNALRERCPDLLPQGGCGGGGDLSSATPKNAIPHLIKFFVFFIRKERKGVFFGLFSCCLSLFHSPTVCLSVVHTETHTALYPVVNGSHMPSS